VTQEDGIESSFKVGFDGVRKLLLDQLRLPEIDLFNVAVCDALLTVKCFSGFGIEFVLLPAKHDQVCYSSFK